MDPTRRWRTLGETILTSLLLSNAFLLPTRHYITSPLLLSSDASPVTTSTPSPSSSSTTTTTTTTTSSSSSTSATSYSSSSSTSTTTPSDQQEWSILLSAFKMYKAAYGDLKVPSRFIVPSSPPWPPSTWQLKLGRRVASIRSTGRYISDESRRKILDDLGFSWRLRNARVDEVEEGVVGVALERYREIYGGVAVPLNFCVPDCEPWEESTRGLPLGKMVSEGADRRYARIVEGLVAYKERYGDLNVGGNFVVPEGDGWPEETWGLRLGARVVAIRGGTFVRGDSKRREELDRLGFVWEVAEEGRKRGRKKKSEVRIDEKDGDYDEDEDYAQEESFGSLSAGTTGSVSLNEFGDGYFTGDRPPQWGFEDEDEDTDDPVNPPKEPTVLQVEKPFNETLEEMAEVAKSVGIMEGWTHNKRVIKGKIDKFVPWRNDDFGADFCFEDVVEALTLYKQVYQSLDGIEESDFIIPEPVEDSLRLSPFELAAMNDNIDGSWDDPDADLMKSSDWPEHLAGMKLGHIVARMRDGDLEVKHLPERKTKLDELGFDWGDPRRFIDVPFDKFMCALYTYFMIRGDTCVLKEFAMPEEQPWPRALAGYKLGHAVHRLRELQTFLETFHPVKMSLLRMFDFMFFPELALPLDPDSDKINMEHLYVETFGHPLYHISTVPLGLPERMLADGPNGPPEKLSSWYNYDYVREFHERPGALTDVADWMRDIGFVQLAEEHEQKYGQSHYRQLCLLKDRLDSGEITKVVWDQEIVRIQRAVTVEFETWRERGTGTPSVANAEYDNNTDEDSYYFSTLDINSASGESSIYERPVMSISSRDVMEEPVAQFTLKSRDEDQ